MSLMERFNNSKVDGELLAMGAIGTLAAAMVLNSVVNNRKEQYKKVTDTKNSETYDTINDYIRSGRRG